MGVPSEKIAWGLAHISDELDYLLKQAEACCDDDLSEELLLIKSAVWCLMGEVGDQ